ncbi:uncharacterized protein [Periplaneta americana]|uniref:uncharacterized protein n=1 Tax=Periplaneta americana TaxID=6978 RepID=UPI0037E6FDA6
MDEHQMPPTECFDQRTPDSDGYTRWSSSKNVKDIDPPVAQIIPRTMVQVPGAVDSDMIASEVGVVFVEVEGARLAPNPSKDVSPSTAGPSNSGAAETTATATPAAPVDYTRKRRNMPAVCVIDITMISVEQQSSEEHEHILQMTKFHHRKAEAAYSQLKADQQSSKGRFTTDDTDT